MTIQEKIASEIKNSTLTQVEIARQLNVRQQTINAYANAKITPSLEQFAKLCKLLDLDANYILGITTFEGKKNEIK